MLIVFEINGKNKVEQIYPPIETNIIDIINRYMKQINHDFNSILYAGKLFTKENMSELLPYLNDLTTLRVFSTERKTVDELVSLIYMYDIQLISKIKPVASDQHYSTVPKIISSYSDEQRNELLKKISDKLTEKNGYEITLNIYHNYIFYDIKYFTHLCRSFGYTLENGLEVISDMSDIKANPYKEYAFIYMAYDLLSEIPSYAENKLKNLNVLSNIKEYVKEYIRNLDTMTIIPYDEYIARFPQPPPPSSLPSPPSSLPQSSQRNIPLYKQLSMGPPPPLPLRKKNSGGYYQKYLKYKNKYLELKTEMHGEYR